MANLARKKRAKPKAKRRARGRAAVGRGLVARKARPAKQVRRGTRKRGSRY
jgi:hypothetical protein